MSLVEGGGAAYGAGATFYLSLIGVAAALWGLYSVMTRTLPDVPTSALGSFYAASAVVALVAHAFLEPWVVPSLDEWLAIAALGCLPMGLAIYFWDYGLKRGDIQALGAFSYVEPFVGAVLVALFTNTVLNISLLWSGVMVVGGAVLASASLWRKKTPLLHVAHEIQGRSKGATLLDALAGVSTADELASVSNEIIRRLSEIWKLGEARQPHDAEKRLLLDALALTNQVWNGLDEDTPSGNLRSAPNTPSAFAA